MMGIIEQMVLLLYSIKSSVEVVPVVKSKVLD